MILARVTPLPTPTERPAYPFTIIIFMSAGVIMFVLGIMLNLVAPGHNTDPYPILAIRYWVDKRAIKPFLGAGIGVETAVLARARIASR